MKIIIIYLVVLIFSIKFVDASNKLYYKLPITFFNMLFFVMKYFSLGTLLIILSIYLLESNNF
jgi:hypothetical protein